MSELDLGAPLAHPAPLLLEPPAPVPVVKTEQVAGMVQVPESKVAELQAKASTFATELATYDPRSPEFSKKVESISNMGAADLAATASVSNRLLERPAAAMRGTRGEGGDVTARVARTLGDLRITVTELDPARADLQGAKKVLRFLPGGSQVQRYFARYESSQGQLNAIDKALLSGQDELRKDNAAIEQERGAMWVTMGKLSEYASLAQALDAAIEAEITRLQNSGETEKANQLQSDALFPIRQRRQDILTQMAVAAQGYLALDLVKKNNSELVKGVDRARNTTMAALRTAVIVAQALENQKLVLDQIDSLNSVTSSLIQSTSQLLKTQGVVINQRSAQTTISMESLQVAFQNVFETMDAIDTYRGRAVVSMGTTITALEEQISKARPYLERANRGQIEA